MALIPCPECQTQISDLAPTCPRCGYPIAIRPASAPSPSPTLASASRNAVRSALRFLVSAVGWTFAALTFVAIFMFGLPFVQSLRDAHEQSRLQPTHQIEYVLAGDRLLKAWAEATAADVDDPNRAIEAWEAYNVARKGLLSEMPELTEDFRATYLEHTQIYDAILDLLRSVPQDSLSLAALGAANLMQGGRIAQEIQERSVSLENRYRDTTNRLEQIALREGARINWNPLPMVSSVEEGAATDSGIGRSWLLVAIDGRPLDGSETDLNVYREVLDPDRYENRIREIPLEFLTPHGRREVQIAGWDAPAITLLDASNQTIELWSRSDHPDP
ncbi:zinc ribbon domain-containing protein [Tautonia rosea]|uniref:zinc ribbon domain-containing protein n=1 Tax=Tautonia rosea TaxID=2728037 RepID=UPI001473B06D|nr:zinc ribbon domain-containing protein [Tautonia rosea]